MYIDESAKELFSNRVIERVCITKMSFMECVLELAEEMELDPIAAGKMLTTPIIEQIEEEAQNLHFFKKSKYKKLPFD